MRGDGGLRVDATRAVRVSKHSHFLLRLVPVTLPPSKLPALSLPRQLERPPVRARLASSAELLAGLTITYQRKHEPVNDD